MRSLDKYERIMRLITVKPERSINPVAFGKKMFKRLEQVIDDPTVDIVGIIKNCLNSHDPNVRLGTLRALIMAAKADQDMTAAIDDIDSLTDEQVIARLAALERDFTAQVTPTATH